MSSTMCCSIANASRSPRSGAQPAAVAKTTATCPLACRTAVDSCRTAAPRGPGHEAGPPLVAVPGHAGSGSPPLVRGDVTEANEFSPPHRARLGAEELITSTTHNRFGCGRRGPVRSRAPALLLSEWAGQLRSDRGVCGSLIMTCAGGHSSPTSALAWSCASTTSRTLLSRLIARYLKEPWPAPFGTRPGGK